jgi:hypothetical protein
MYKVGLPCDCVWSYCSSDDVEFRATLQQMVSGIALPFNRLALRA